MGRRSARQNAGIRVYYGKKRAPKGRIVANPAIMSRRCGDFKKCGEQCKNKSRYDICHHHAKCNHGVFISQSKLIGGYGLFALRKFKKGEIIGSYTGETLPYLLSCST